MSCEWCPIHPVTQPTRLKSALPPPPPSALHCLPSPPGLVLPPGLLSEACRPPHHSLAATLSSLTWILPSPGASPPSICFLHSSEGDESASVASLLKNAKGLPTTHATKTS